MSDLLTMLREHDLPPRWDGHRTLTHWPDHSHLYRTRRTP